MRARLKSPATVLAAVLALLIIASVVIWLQIGSQLGIKLLSWLPSEDTNKIEPYTDEKESEPRTFSPDLDEQGIEEPSLEDISGASEPVTSDLEQYPGFRYINWELDERAFEYEELAREYLTANCMEEQGWQYFPTATVRNAGSQVGTDKKFMKKSQLG